MRKYIVLYTFFVGLVFVLIYSTITALNDSILKSEKFMKSKIGIQIVVKNDTLLIVDYSIWKNTYKLSNGLEIDTSFFNLQKK